MELLHKYHKQTLDKKTRKHFAKLNDTYQLGLNIKHDRDILRLSVFETGLTNKAYFEASFEQTRTHQYDMWDHLSFQERNRLISCDIAPFKTQLKSFYHENTIIFIPFFDLLLNNLYEHETAILELPQFFRLYRDFNHQLIPVDTYGLKPYQNNMAFAPCVAFDDHHVVLFDASINTFYTLNDQLQLTRYPLFQKTLLDDQQVQTIAAAMLTNEPTHLMDILFEYKALSPRCIKALLKQRRKAK